jgi:hypothetical protein
LREKHIEDHADKLEKYEKLVRQYIDYWIPVLGLDNWSRIDITCSPSTKPDQDGVLGETVCLWQYLEADLIFYLGEFIKNDPDDERIEYIILHELCHVIVNEMNPYPQDSEERSIYRKYVVPHEERVVTQLALSFMRSRDTATEETKKLNEKVTKKAAKKK